MMGTFAVVPRNRIAAGSSSRTGCELREKPGGIWLKFYKLLFLTVLTAVLFAGCWGGGDDPGPKAQNVAQQAPQVSGEVPEEEPVARIAAQVGPSVVQVNVEAVQLTPFGAQEAQGLGSGVIYRRDGYIITNNHVVEGASSVNVAFADGSTEQGEVVGTDPTTDLAVIRVDREGLPPAKFRESADLTVGQLAVAIGSPSGFQSTVTSGVISGLNRSVPSQLTGGAQERSLVDLIQTDAAISPGSSGGALVDREGEVIGINVAYLPPAQTGAESIGFAIPSDTAISVADQIIETGEAANPYIGIAYTDLTPDIAAQFDISAENGVIVTGLEPGSPAAEAGLQPEDVITSLDSSQVTSSGDLLGALRDYEPGDQVTLTIVRGGNEQQVEITLGERSAQQLR